MVADVKNKVVPLSKLRDELFSPISITNQSTSSLSIELGILSATAILTELRDHTKATASYLSSVGGKFSWANTSNESNMNGMNKFAVNDPAESSFGGTTRQIQYFGRIGLTNAGGVDQVRRNGDLSRGYCKKSKSKQQTNELGIFHKMDEEMKITLLTMARESVKDTRVYDRTALSKQRQEKQKKQELIQENCMKKASESFIDALYYHEMFGSASCWMNIPSVDCELRKLKSKSAKITALKENIRIRVLGLGWEDLATPWSINGKDLTSDELAKHLKSIIKEQRKRSIPSKPPIPLPERKDLPILGTKTLDLAVIESTHLLKGENFERDAHAIRNKREADGVGDRYAGLQPMSRPNIDQSLLGKRLDVCEKYTLEEGGIELRWSQGTVVKISNGSNILKPGARTAKFKKGEAVLIKWDANPARNEMESTSAQRLLLSKWNPKQTHTAGSWRFDFSRE